MLTVCDLLILVLLTMFIIIRETHAEAFTCISLICKRSMRSNYYPHFIGEETEPLRGSHSPTVISIIRERVPILTQFLVTTACAHTSSCFLVEETELAQTWRAVPTACLEVMRASWEGLCRGETGRMLGIETGASLPVWLMNMLKVLSFQLPVWAKRCLCAAKGGGGPGSPREKDPQFQG